MVTQEVLRELLGRAEHSDIDFKAEPHRFDNDHFKSEFIKDIVAMANTIRAGSAYIVSGVKLRADGERELIGVSNHPDDADLQDRLNLAKIEPKPSFTYQPVTVDGLSYGVIEIPLRKDGPYLPGRDFGVLKAHRVYFRRGTKNDEATVHERKQIYQWFLGQTEHSLVDPLGGVPLIPNWDEFAVACHRFDHNRAYVLVIGQTAHATETYHFLGRLPLSVVLDFDPSTEEGGVYSLAGSSLRNSRSVHLCTLKDEYTLVPEKACCWYAARGLKGRANSLSEGDWREWNRKYGASLQELFVNLAKAAGGRPLTVISLWYAPEYLREVCSAVDRAFGDSADYVFTLPDAERLRDMAQQFTGKVISMSFEDVLHGIAQNIRTSDGEVPIYAGIPTNDGSFTVLSTPTLRWLSEDLEVLHSNIEMEGAEGADGRDFLRGVTISWADLSNGCDAERDKTSRIQEQVERDLRSRTASRLNLYHWPGAGGTTVARRIAWNLRRRYPSVMLRRVTLGHTIGRFRELFRLTSQPILAVVEGADAIPDRLEQLHTEVRTEHIPVVFLSVLRRHEVRSDAERSIFLGSNLSLPESYRFVQAYKRVAPNAAARLDRIHDNADLKERTPFHFALSAFGREYLGLSKYVQARLQEGTRLQREILTYLALSYYYGHKPMLAQIFAPHLGYPENRQVRLESLLTDLLLELLVQEGDCKWRPSHQLIAEEILQESLAAGSADKRTWKGGLFTWASDFIRMCRKGVLVPSSDLIDLLRRIFILRDEHELLGTEGSGSARFALLVEDIPTTEERLAVLRELVESFPEEPHFWGHLGRLYSIELNEHVEAIKALDQAISLSSDSPDPVLYHMKGMSYRRIAYEMMEALKSKEPTREDLLQVREVVESAKEAFAVARSLDPDSEHAHISPVQLLLKLIDFGFAVSGNKSRADFLVAASSTWYRDQLDEIENLMDRAHGIREGDKQSQYVVSCEAELDQIYDDYARALEGWNNLLTRKDVFAPPVRRQIVRAYLTRQHRDWASVPQDEIERIIDLMEDNMKEEPTSDHNIRIWFRALRYSVRQDIDTALARLANWKVLGDSLEAHFYVYVLHVLKAIDGSMIEQVKSEDLIQQMRAKARNRRNRTRSYDWYGKGQGLRRLIHYSELGEWDESADFYRNTAVLDRLDGRVTKIAGPEAGTVELSSCGLTAFFVPARAGVIKGRDENLAVRFYLGFSYDGLRAWSVKAIE